MLEKYTFFLNTKFFLAERKESATLDQLLKIEIPKKEGLFQGFPTNFSQNTKSNPRLLPNL